MRKEHAGACAIGGGPSNPIEAAGLHHARLFVPCFSLAAVPTADFESGGFLGLARFARSRCGWTTDPPVNHLLTKSRLLNLHMVCTFPPCLVGVLVVTIRPMLDGNQAFTPEDVVASRAAFDDCVKALRLLDRSDPAVALVAKGIIVLARHGERNAEWLAEQQSFRDESTGKARARRVD